MSTIIKIEGSEAQQKSVVSFMQFRKIPFAEWSKDRAITLIAETLVNQRLMRNGAPPFANPLEAMPAHLREQVMEDAEAVYNAINPEK